MALREGLLSLINNRFATLRISLYADDAAIFVNPVREEIQIVANILELFGSVSGLVTNRSKSAAFPIRCDDINLEEVLMGF